MHMAAHHMQVHSPTGRHAAKRWVMIVSAFANIAPAGCLVVSRPAGGIIPTFVGLLIFGALALFGAHNYAQALTITGCCTLPEVWRRCIGRWTAFIPILTTAFTCFSCCVGYANFYGHLLANVWPWNPVPGIVQSPEGWYVLLSGLVPMTFLVCLKDISVMRVSTAIAGLSCCMVPVVAGWRYFDGSYKETGKWSQHATFTDSRPDVREFWQFHEMPSRLVSIQGVLFLFHFNAVKYFRELEQPKVSRYTTGVGVSIGLGLIVVLSTMIFVFLTFGHQTMMLTMDNYAANDNLANTARVAISIGLIGCFPLLFSGMREALVELLNDLFPSCVPTFQTVIFQNAVSLSLLVAVIAVTNASRRLDLLLINIGRCCCGSLLIYTVPGMIYLGAARRHTSWERLTTPHVVLTIMVGVFGIVMVVTSACVWSWYGLS
uniref:Amino acid transporter transmembrane domain-containing protein n=1 Tax=Alexandrium monilatum TaxID=311494 RepID=A0A6T0WAG8_9DINO